MRKSSDKYFLDDPDFDTDHEILKNKLGLTDSLILERIEVKKLALAIEQATRSYDVDYRFSSKDICDLHRMFLGDVFTWAGKYRTVDISSPQIRWCHAPYIEAEMDRYSNLLSEITPFTPDLSREVLTRRLAKIHGDLIVIHPFRDGNGRVTRLLCDLLLGQSQLEIVDLQTFYDNQIREKYHQAIREIWTQGVYQKLIDLYSHLIHWR